MENLINKNSLHQVSELNPGNFTFDTTSFFAIAGNQVCGTCVGA